MEVGPFRTIPATQTESGKVEVRLVEGGWEEFANIVFGASASVSLPQRMILMIVDQPPGTGLSFVPTNGYLHELDQVSDTGFEDAAGLTGRGHSISFSS
jgi:carboxypeptidase D